MQERNGRFGVLAAQCAVCVAIVLTALAFRFLGGSVFETLRDAFYTAFQDDSLGVALMERWNGLELV